MYIEAKNRYYPIEICPGFWKALVDQYEKRRVSSIDRVKEELSQAGKSRRKKKDGEEPDEEDWLSKWVNDDVPDGFFKKTQDNAVVSMFRELVKWVYGQRQYTDKAKSEFAVAADGWLIAFAQVNGMTLVTEEVLKPEIKIKVPIPNVCPQFGVEYVNTFQMLRDLQVRFDLKKRR